LKGAQMLADYINTVRQIFPHEPIRVVTHSHGGNVALASTNARYVQGPARMDTAIVVAKPYFELYHNQEKVDRFNARFKSRDTILLPTMDLYEPEPKNLGGPVLSIFSSRDMVQTSLADLADRETTHMSLRSTRTYQGAGDLKRSFVNIEIPTFVGGVNAHGVLHSRVIGKAIGAFIATNGRSQEDWIRSARSSGFYGALWAQTGYYATPRGDWKNVGIWNRFEMGQ
jgi:hypothetical protein